MSAWMSGKVVGVHLRHVWGYSHSQRLQTFREAAFYGELQRRAGDELQSSGIADGARPWMLVEFSPAPRSDAEYVRIVNECAAYARRQR